jgi:hypothetical protein
VAQTIRLDQLAAAIREIVHEQAAEATHKLRTRAVPEALARLEAKVIGKTNDEGLVDMGLYKLSWKVQLTPDGGELVNTAPYASVLELGRRPNRPGPPRGPILEWIRRKLVPNGKIVPDEGETMDEAAVRASYLIRNSIHKNGTPGRRVLGEATRLHLPNYLRDAVKLHIG